MAEKGRFIVLEGIDGCGKTTHAELLSRELARRTGGKCIVEREPDSRDIIGAIIRSALYGSVRISPEAMAYLHVADRLEHIAYMQPILAQGTSIICDRYFVSNMAYNASDTLSVERIYELNRPCFEKLRPDAVVFLDVPPQETARRRAAERSDEEIYDRMERQIRIYENYMRALEIIAADGMKVVRVDATGPSERVSAEIVRGLGI
jgi:dTMP kinase